MKRTITILSLVFVLTVAAFAQAAPAQQPKPEHLSKQQLNTLIATAKTPAEHERIAQYYQAKVLYYTGSVQRTRADGCGVQCEPQSWRQIQGNLH